MLTDGKIDAKRGKSDAKWRESKYFSGKQSIFSKKSQKITHFYLKKPFFYKKFSTISRDANLPFSTISTVFYYIKILSPPKVILYREFLLVYLTLLYRELTVLTDRLMLNASTIYPTCMLRKKMTMIICLPSWRIKIPVIYRHVCTSRARSFTCHCAHVSTSNFEPIFPN